MTAPTPSHDRGTRADGLYQAVAVLDDRASECESVGNDDGAELLWTLAATLAETARRLTR